VSNITPKCSLLRSPFVSRRNSLAIHSDGGAESQHRHVTWMCVSSNVTHTSLRSVEGAPAVGATWTKPPNGSFAE
jgi:hypothetical protein